jgi:hypothetical protein
MQSKFEGPVQVVQPGSQATHFPMETIKNWPDGQELSGVTEASALQIFVASAKTVPSTGARV